MSCDGAWAASLTLGSVLLAGCIVTLVSSTVTCPIALHCWVGLREDGVRAGGVGGVNFHTIKGTGVWGVYRGTLISDGRERFGFIRTLIIGGTTKELLVVPPCFNQSEVIAVLSTEK